MICINIGTLIYLKFNPKMMFKQHKNINAYTKWFNTIPLLGTTALGANAYFNNNKDE